LLAILFNNAKGCQDEDIINTSLGLIDCVLNHPDCDQTELYDQFKDEDSFLNRFSKSLH
jgi:hypothetical protein